MQGATLYRQEPPARGSAGATERVTVPVPMRAALARQRTASTMCNGPGEGALLTVFTDIPAR
jgi:hypothetical protein